MIQDLVDNYDDFGDALITELQYFNGYNFPSDSFENTTLKVSISCFNKNRNYGRDLITIHCTDIISFIYEKWDGRIFEALLTEDNGEIILDFAHESYHPYFIIKCRKVSYEIIAQK